MTKELREQLAEILPHKESDIEDAVVHLIKELKLLKTELRDVRTTLVCLKQSLIDFNIKEAWKQ